MVRTYKIKNQLLIIFLVVGFLIGILYVNVVSWNGMFLSELFQKTTLHQMGQIEIIHEKYFWYVVKERCYYLILLCILACLKWKKIFVGIVLGISGFLYGVLMVLAVLQLGIKGILFCLVGLLPQMIFYGMAYGVLLSYWYYFPERKWNRMKTIFVIVMFGVGIITEVYINPLLVKGIVRII